MAVRAKKIQPAKAQAIEEAKKTFATSPLRNCGYWPRPAAREPNLPYAVKNM